MPTPRSSVTRGQKARQREGADEAWTGVDGSRNLRFFGE